MKIQGINFHLVLRLKNLKKEDDFIALCIQPILASLYSFLLAYIQAIRKLE